MFKGHPKGLAPLFFTEMWERLSFYLLVGILVLYASDAERGGLGLTVQEAMSIYGTYLAFVYFTPFLGGMIADRLIGFRRAVLIGGVFFAIGLFLLGVPGTTPFYTGLVLLCIGNGLFKPNISAMVGNLYERGDPKRDAGFNIFYMGINVGAAAANLAAAPIRNYISWRWTFWFAAIGICIGLIILLANWRLLERADRKPEASADGLGFGVVFGKILLPAMIFGAAGYFLAQGVPAIGDRVAPSMCGFLLGMVPIFFFIARLAHRAPAEERPGLLALMPVFVAGGTFFMILHLNGSAFTIWCKDSTNRQVAWVPKIWCQEALPSYFENADPEVPRPDERTLLVVDPVATMMAGTKKMTESKLAELESQGLEPVVLWTADGGRTAEHLPDDLATYVYPDDEITLKVESSGADGSPPTVSVTLADGAKPVERVVFTTTIEGRSIPVVLVDQSTFDRTYQGAGSARLPPGEFLRVASPEVYQSWNPIFVVLFTPAIVWYFNRRQRMGRGISTARKLLYGMLLTALAMLVMSGAGLVSDGGDVKVLGLWMVVSYAIITVGELCLSPMGLSLVTKLSPKRLVGMMMGGWFCATAFGNKLSGFLGEIQDKMEPHHFFLLLVGACLVVAAFLWAMLPRLDRTLKSYGA